MKLRDLIANVGRHDEWDEDARRLFWDEYRSLVSEADDRLAEPVAYLLWCDYFEDAEKWSRKRGRKSPAPRN